MFEAFEMIMNRLEACGDAFCDYRNNIYYVTLNDFAGFDSNWCEIDRPYKDEEMVDALLDLLDSAEEKTIGWNTYYCFDTFMVDLSYSSEDI